MRSFVHLSLHTEYSLVDSVVRIGPMIAAARDHGLPAVAVTDYGSVSAMVKLYRHATANGIKPIIGADVLIGTLGGDRDATSLSLLCANRDGFKNLSRLLTRSHMEGKASGAPVIDKDWLSRKSLEGLIALSGGLSGEIGQSLLGPRREQAPALLTAWQRLMPDRFYVELRRLGQPDEEEYNQGAVELAASACAPIVATNAVRFVDKSDFDAHETRVCIASGRALDDPDRPRAYTEEQYLKSASEMEALFHDLPEALDNSLEIAIRCNLDIEFGKVFLPDFELVEGNSPQDYLRKRAEDGLHKRLARIPTGGRQEEIYRQRLEREFDVICEMGFEGYFLIVADFIEWSRLNSIPVGPGRGSGAGSLIAYALGITDLDPIEHDLLFERFLNPERVSMPDFDIDFCIEGRDRVIDYVSERYGRDQVAQIITYGTMSARAVVRDVGRVLGMSYGYVDRIAKLIPFELGITLQKALDEDEELRELYASEDDVQLLINMAMRLEGLARNAGTHAGGVVIAPAAMTEFMPVFAAQEGGLLTQLDKDDLEAIGLVKFDFLGLKTLTIIDKAVASINERRSRRNEPAIDLESLGMDDTETYRLLNECRTTAVFQLESRGMRDLIKRLKPDCFDDLVAILALFRPGPLQTGMVDDFIERKHGKNAAPIDYLHPSLEPILKPTYGVILYQEQVMQIAQVLAGYSLGGADLLRRAMGKKKPEEMAKQRSVFEEGAAEQGIESNVARHIFDLMEKFAGYGFNKSHSAAYALVAYQTAWLKAHFPAAFMAAAMSADLDHTDKLVVLKDDCRALGIELAPPDINRSAIEFDVDGENRVLYGLAAIKGVGRSVAQSVVAEREASGSYTDLLDLCRRVGTHKLNRRVLEALVRSGTLDGLGMNRATLMHAIPSVLRFTEQAQYALAAGQGALFGSSEGALDYEFTEVREWNPREKLEAERESLGLYLTGHPFTDYAPHCRHFTHGLLSGVLASLPEGSDYRLRREVAVAGVVMDIRRRGNRVSILLDDNTERIEATLFDEVYAQSKHLISKHAILVVRGQLRFDEFLNAWTLTAQNVQTVDEAIECHARRMTICVNEQKSRGDLVGALKSILMPYIGGQCEVSVNLLTGVAQAEITLGSEWAVRPTRELREQLANHLGDECVSLHYPKHVWQI